MYLVTSISTHVQVFQVREKVSICNYTYTILIVRYLYRMMYIYVLYVRMCSVLRWNDIRAYFNVRIQAYFITEKMRKLN